MRRGRTHTFIHRNKSNILVPIDQSPRQDYELGDVLLFPPNLFPPFPLHCWFSPYPSPFGCLVSLHTIRGNVFDKFIGRNLMHYYPEAQIREDSCPNSLHIKRILLIPNVNSKIK